MHVLHQTTCIIRPHVHVLHQTMSNMMWRIISKQIGRLSQHVPTGWLEINWISYATSLIICWTQELLGHLVVTGPRRCIWVRKKALSDWRPCGDYCALNRIKIRVRTPQQESFLQDTCRLREGLSADTRGARWCAQNCLHNSVWPIRICANAFRTAQRSANFPALYWQSIAWITHCLCVHRRLASRIWWHVCNSTSSTCACFSSDYNTLLQVLNPKECSFGLTELNFLDHHIDQHGISPLPDKVATIRDCKVPTSLKPLRGFLGL